MRNFKIKIGAEPLSEIQEIINWYNFKKAGLGKVFYAKIKSTTKSLKSNPFIFEKRYGNIRCVGVGKFPYLIHFEIIESENSINITTIKHTSRNPNLWLEADKE